MPLDLPAAITSFTTKARKWNRDHFGNIFHRKRKICARLKRVQVALGINPGNFLVDLEQSLLQELSNIENLEAEFWSMKARISWLIEGDRNTTFFHNSTLVRRRRNRITSMKDQSGNSLNGEQAIANFIRQGFKDLFTTSHDSATWRDWQPPFWRCSLKAEDIIKLDLPLTDGEIFDALHSLKPYTAPGPDGLHMGFSHRF